MVFQAVLQVVGPMLLELVIREVAVPAAKRMVQGAAPETSDDLVALRPDIAPQGPRLQALSTVQIVSEVPGRVRYEVAGLRGQTDLARKIADEVATLDGVTRTDASAQTGRLLVQFDPEAQSTASVAAAIDRARSLHLAHTTSRTRRLATVV